MLLTANAEYLFYYGNAIRYTRHFKFRSTSTHRQTRSSYYSTRSAEGFYMPRYLDGLWGGSVPPTLKCPGRGDRGTSLCLRVVPEGPRRHPRDTRPFVLNVARGTRTCRHVWVGPVGRRTEQSTELGRMGDGEGLP